MYVASTYTTLHPPSVGLFSLRATNVNDLRQKSHSTTIIECLTSSRIQNHATQGRARSSRRFGSCSVKRSIDSGLFELGDERQDRVGGPCARHLGEIIVVARKGRCMLLDYRCVGKENSGIYNVCCTYMNSSCRGSYLSWVKERRNAQTSFICKSSPLADTIS